jgi:transcriptional regulator with XRE-family HTH domain
MKDKIQQLMTKEGLTSSRLAEMLGTGASNISHILSGRSKPGYDLLRKILQCFPQVNPDWLLLDDTAMYREDQTLSSTPTSSATNDLFSSIAHVVTPLTSAATATLQKETENVEKLSSTTVAPQATNGRDRVQRIVVIYEDGSFESFVSR